jgi:hypothetical protein
MFKMYIAVLGKVQLPAALLMVLQVNLSMESFIATRKNMSKVCIPDTKGGKEWTRGDNERESLGRTTFAHWQGYRQRAGDHNGGFAGAGRRRREKK